MARLEDEFRNTLISHNSPQELDSLYVSSYLFSFLEDDYQDGESEEQEEATSIGSTGSSSDNMREMDLISEKEIEDFRKIAARMVAAGYTQECIQAYCSIRKPIIDLMFSRIGIERLSIGDGTTTLLRPSSDLENDGSNGLTEKLMEPAHTEKHFMSGEIARDNIIGIFDDLTIPFALVASLSGANASSSSTGLQSKRYRKFRCGTCKKLFLSYQALGGHRAGHKRCCAPPRLIPELVGGRKICECPFFLFQGVRVRPGSRRLPCCKERSKSLLSQTKMSES